MKPSKTTTKLTFFFFVIIAAAVDAALNFVVICVSPAHFCIHRPILHYFTCTAERKRSKKVELKHPDILSFFFFF